MPFALPFAFPFVKGCAFPLALPLPLPRVEFIDQRLSPLEAKFLLACVPKVCTAPDTWGEIMKHIYLLVIECACERVSS